MDMAKETEIPDHKYYGGYNPDPHQSNDRDPWVLTISGTGSGAAHRTLKAVLDCQPPGVIKLEIG